MGDTIGLKVGRELWYIWKYRVPLEVKQAIKQALIQMIRNYTKIEVKVQQNQNLVVYNVVMPKIELNVNSKGKKAREDPEILKESIKVLKQQLREAKHSINYYKRKYEEAEAKLKELKKELSERDKRIKELEARLSEISPEVVKRKTEGKVVRRFKSVLYNLVKSKVLTREQLSAIYQAMGW